MSAMLCYGYITYIHTCSSCEFHWYDRFLLSQSHVFGVCTWCGSFSWLTFLYLCYSASGCPISSTSNLLIETDLHFSCTCECFVMRLLLRFLLMWIEGLSSNGIDNSNFRLALCPRFSKPFAFWVCFWLKWFYTLFNF